MPSGEFSHEMEHLGPCSGIKAGERLIQEKNGTLAQKDACQGYSLLLAAGEAGDRGIDISCEVHGSENLLCLEYLFRCTVCATVQADEDILDSSQVLEEIVGLKED